MMTLFFQAGPVIDWDTAKRSDTQAFARLFWGLAERGIYFPCSQFEALFVSAAHSEADVDLALALASEVLALPGIRQIILAGNCRFSPGFTTLASSSKRLEFPEIFVSLVPNRGCTTPPHSRHLSKKKKIFCMSFL